MDSDKAIAMYEYYMKKWGLLDSGWKLVLNGRFGDVLGRCVYVRKEIQISKRLVHSGIDECVHREVILHEIGHAITDSKLPAHGKEWADNVRKVGGSPRKAIPLTHEQCAALHSYRLVLAMHDSVRPMRLPAYSDRLGRGIPADIKKRYSKKLQAYMRWVPSCSCAVHETISLRAYLEKVELATMEEPPMVIGL